MQTLKEQISNKCIHFNGIMNKCCNAGVDYDTVKVDRPFKFPCLKQGGECSQASFPTDEQVEAIEKQIDSSGLKTLTAYAKIKQHFISTKEHSGKVPCECGGELKYRVAASNGHIWAKCTTCEISFME